MTDKEGVRTRDRWTKFCPQCGKQTDEFFDSVCEQCFRQGITLLAFESQELSVSICPHCDGFFKGKEQTSIEAVVEDAVRKAIKKKFGSETPVELAGLHVELAENKRSAHVSVAVEAEIKGVTIAERGEQAFTLKRAICERCSRIAGGYYAAIVESKPTSAISPIGVSAGAAWRPICSLVPIVKSSKPKKSVPDAVLPNVALVNGLSKSMNP